MLNEINMRSFLTLVRTGSFTETSKQLHFTQQAVSKHLARLEADLDCELIVRKRGSVTMTEMGAIYFKAFSEMIGILDRARDEAEKISSNRDDSLYIIHLDLLDINWFFKYLYKNFFKYYPEIKLAYSSAPDWKTVNWILEGKADMAITFAEELADYSDQLEFIQIEKTREMLIVSSDNPKATADAVYTDFLDQPVFYTPEDTHNLPQMLERMKAIGFSANNLVESENLLSTCSSVEMMLGVAILSERCRLIDSPLLRAYPTGQVGSLSIAFLKNNNKRVLRKFVNYLRSDLGKL